jgi:hypothetical protein
MREWMYKIHVFLISALLGDEWSASCPGRFTPEERSSATHWVGYCLGPRTGLDYVKRGENICRYRDSNSDHLAVQPVSNRYIDCSLT